MELKNGIEGLFNILSIIGQTNKMKNDGTEIISYKNTYSFLIILLCCIIKARNQ